MFGLIRGSRFAAAFLMFAHIATPSFAAETQQDASVQQAAPVDQSFLQFQRQLPLKDLVGSYVDYGKQDAEELCLAKAVYFEARGETLEGQLAVAEVVMNRAASGLYPATWCQVVTQPAQFSFIRKGQFPRVDADCPDWREAKAIADIARRQLADQLAPNVLWYHATYVAPSWGRRLTKVAQIGTHIFYS